MRHEGQKQEDKKETGNEGKDNNQRRQDNRRNEHRDNRNKAGRPQQGRTDQPDKNRNHATKVLTGLNPLTGIKINPITRIREIRNTEINNAGPVIAPTTAMLRLLPMLNLNKIN
ncbi:MAG: hypothetical protein HWD63_01130 [Candidatus Parvibacillus calidus]|nr:MAG: hypothetical protein HWD63_01130 [Candidatus Parvibacillus calidus]